MFLSVGLCSTNTNKQPDSTRAISRRLLLISQPNSYRIAPYIGAAQQMGVRVLIASRGEHSLTTEVNQGLNIDLDDHASALSAILHAARLDPFAGIIGSDDSTVELAALAANRLGLPHNPPEAARLTRRKDLARAHLMRSGCPVPRHCLIDIKRPLDRQMAGLPWPCVIKPVNMSASRGVIRANNEDEFRTACERVGNIIAESRDAFERSHVLVEDYIDGIEIAYEGYLHQGEIAHTDGIRQTGSSGRPFLRRNHLCHAIPARCCFTAIGSNSGCNRLARLLACEPGQCTPSLRLNASDAWILEVASRTIGGDCARMLDSGTNKSLEQLTVVTGHWPAAEAHADRAKPRCDDDTDPTSRTYCDASKVFWLRRKCPISKKSISRSVRAMS